MGPERETRKSRQGIDAGSREDEWGVYDKLRELGLSSELLLLLAGNPNATTLAVKKLLKEKSGGVTPNAKNSKLVFSTELGRLYRGDCLDVMQMMPNESVDVIFADPPFNLAKSYRNGRRDDLPDADYLEWTHTWLDACVAKLKPGGAFFVYNIPKWNVQIGSHLAKQLTFRHWIAIDMTYSFPIQKRLYPAHYSLLYFIKGHSPNRFSPPRLPIVTCPRCGKEHNDYGGHKAKMNPRGVNLSDVWYDIPPIRHRNKKNRKANELSIKLVDRVLDIASKPGDLIFDPFGGSGTTYIASEIRNRRWIGCELGSCQSIIRRFQNYQSEEQRLLKDRERLNKLFTDEALVARMKHGLSFHKYRILRDQLARVRKACC